MSGEYETSSALKHDLSGTQKFMKWIIIGLSILYLIFGIVLIAVGSYAMSGDVAKVTGQTLPQGIITVGVFLLITALIGIGSAWKEFRLGLTIYFVSMLIWSIILIAVGIAVYSQQSNAQNLIAGNWMGLPVELKRSIQVAANCCGRNFYNEQVNYMGAVQDSGAGPFWTQPGGTGAWTCDGSVTPCTCPDPTLSTVCGGPPSSCAPSKGGCVPTLVDEFQKNFKTAGSCGIAFSVIMFVGLAFTCFLMRGIKDKNMNNAIERNRERTERELAEKKKRGKGGLKIPDNVL